MAGGLALECLVGPEFVEGLAPLVECSLLCPQVGSGRRTGFELEGSVHTFVPAVLLWFPRFDSLVLNTQLAPPDG